MGRRASNSGFAARATSRPSGPADPFAAWGRLVHRHRWLILALAPLFLVVTGWLSLGAANLTNLFPKDTESARADSLVASELPHTGDGGSFLLVMSSSRLTVSDPAFGAALSVALAPLRSDSRVSSVQTPFDGGSQPASNMVSGDGHRALVIVSLKHAIRTEDFVQLRGEIHSGQLEVIAGGGPAAGADFDRILESDLHRGEEISLPVTLALLLLVFGSVVAAFLPLQVGILAVVGGLAGTTLLAQRMDVSQYALNIVTLIGLGVAIDYSLFMVSRFREELEGEGGVAGAMERSMASVGRSIAFSGLTVAVGLSGLAFFQGSFLASVGLAGGIVVAFAVVYALTFLPALLAVVGRRVNSLRLGLGRRRSPARGPGFWPRLAEQVMARPVLVLVPALLVLVLAGLPFGQMRLANADTSSLPSGAESRRVEDILSRDFPNQGGSEIEVVINYAVGDPLSSARVGQLYDFDRRLARLPGVTSIASPVDLDPALGRSDYQALLAQPRASLPAAVRQMAGAHIVVLYVKTRWAASSDQARDLVRSIRSQTSPSDGSILVGGRTASDLDLIDFILARAPAAIAFVVVTTCLLLVMLLGSLVLPVKAVIMNVLSISASFGALVWIFQEGHLSGLLGFTPTSLDPSVPVLLFCIVFGLSMDYEVLMLSRMKEEYGRDHDNRRAVASGLGSCGRLVTGAATIMVAVFGSFVSADVVIIKALAGGLAIAVAVDATIVRGLVVPATMRLLGDLNWWAPRAVVRFVERTGLAEAAGRAG